MALSYPLDDQKILEEDYDENYEPTEEEVREYCKVLGLDPAAEKDLLYIAKEGIKAPLPKDWKPVEDSTGNIYYFNFSTGDSTWEHPCDEYYRKLLNQEREKRATKSTEQTDGSMNRGGKKKGITLKGKTGGMVNGSQLRNGGLANGGMVGPTLGALPIMNGSLPHGKLAPLSLGKPLPSIGGLPPLKTPSSLAPLRPPPTLEGGLGASMSSTGGSSKVSERLGTISSRGEGGGLDLGSVRISTQFEDEDTESESGSEEGGYKTKLAGVNLLQAQDLGLKDSDEEFDSTEDVSKELRKIMDISSDQENIDHFPQLVGRPSAPLPSQRGGGVGESPISSPHVLRPGAAKVRGVNNSPPLSKGGPGTQPRVGTGLSSPATVRLGGIESTDMMDHDAIARELKEKRNAELSKLKQELAKELESTKTALLKEKDQKLTLFREELAREQLAEEKKLRSEQASALSEVRNRVIEEREDQEARLEEEKADYIRKLRQQLSNEKEREEKQLHDESSKTLSQLKETLKKEHTKAEADTRSKAEAELTALREKLAKEIAEERDSLEGSLTKDLEAVRENREAQLTQRRAQLETEHQSQLEQLEELREKHKQEFQSAVAEIESSNKLEQLRNERKQAHQQALEELQTQFSTELDKRKAELKVQHEQEMERLTAQYEDELTHAKEEWAEKLSTETQQLNAELEANKSSLQKEHEETIKLLRTKLRAAQTKLEKQVQEKAEELSTLQTEHNTRLSELNSQREQLIQERAQLDTRGAELALERRELVTETEQITSDRAKLELRKAELASEKVELEREQDRLAVLRESSGREREEVTRCQLAEAVERESLEQMKRSHKNLEKEILQLQQQKQAQFSLDQLCQTQTEIKNQISSLQAESAHVVNHQRQPNKEVAEVTKNGGSDGEDDLMEIAELDPLVEDQRELLSDVTRHKVREVSLQEQESLSKRSHHKSHKTMKRDDSNLSLLQEIRVKLNQEAAVLSELEEKMRNSEQGTTHKQSLIKDKDTDLVRELETLSGQDISPAGVPSPRSYLSKLRDSLNHSQHYTRTRHRSSPLPTYHHVSSDGEDDSLTATSADEGVYPSSTARYSAATRKILQETSWSSDRGKESGLVEAASLVGPSTFKEDNTGQKMIFHSLSMINSQLGQLLTRFPEPSSTSHTSHPLHTAHTPHTLHTAHTPHTPPEAIVTSGASNSRWADPPPKHRHIDLDLAEKRRSYIGPHSSVTNGPTALGTSYPLRPSSIVRPQPSTEDLIHSQTDWLKEFQQCVPLTRRPASVASTLPHSLMPSSKPKLVLDRTNNVKLVHI